MSGTKKKLSAWLPSTPCTQGMRESIIEIAEEQGRSIADLQREAITLFLSDFVSKKKSIVSIANAEQEPA